MRGASAFVGARRACAPPSSGGGCFRKLLVASGGYRKLLLAPVPGIFLWLPGKCDLFVEASGEDVAWMSPEASLTLFKV